MAKKEQTSFAEMTPDELRRQLAEVKESLFQLRFQNATAPLKNPREIRARRKDIARINTFLRQKEKGK